MKTLTAILLTLYTLLTVTASPSGAAEPLPFRRAKSVSTSVGRGVIVTLAGAAKRVALADESVASVRIVTERELLINGVAPGRSTLFVWLDDDQRLQFDVRVNRDFGVLVGAMRQIDPRIEVTAAGDGSALLLRGEVDDESSAAQAEAVARGLAGSAKVVAQLRYLGSEPTPQERLEAALQAIDRRITVRRVQVGTEPQPDSDSYVLEGRVGSVSDLVRAVTLAERQLGESGSRVTARDDRQITFRRSGTLSTGGSNGGMQNLQGAEPHPGGLSSQLARGLVITSESGRVLSFLEVDEIYQVMVSIRVLEVDRRRARTLGFDFTFQNDDFSAASLTRPQIADVAARAGDGTLFPRPTGGNLAAAFVGDASALFASIDAMQQKNLARAVAEPNVLTLSGEQATVVVGGEIPIPSTSVNQVASLQGFVFQEFGVRLDIRPTVGHDEIIALEVAPSIVRPTAALGVGGVPGFTVQSVQTTARVKAGESLVIGGLLTFEEGLDERRVPGLGKIPLFRWRKRTRSERELLFIITPRLTSAGSSTEEPIILPTLEWSESRSSLREEVSPGAVGHDGVPSGFRVVPAATAGQK